ncbi:hypothetical protein TSAR_016076 [Trichomalopsis sarcophagae]|uniref:CHK kinase-like domain-containing protein n=1 Tax=Trichomalopsis sarcophagae TaxID=543379 RepID=A0A232EF01_9HYME|nr:hypothetical protein TSAR_016076 [Trichomalopsis sarcophagae]
MAKDKSLLEDVSKYFTEETLQNIVGTLSNEDVKNVEVLSWDFGDANAKGDSYLSTVNKVTIKAKVKNQEKDVKIVVKSLPNNMGRRKTYRSADFFRNEIMFYTEIAATYEKYLKSKNQSSLLILPTCLAFHLDGENDYIALEDVSPLGFGQAARQSCLTFEQSSYMLEAIARFHGVSFAYKDQHKENFEKITSKIFETYFTNELYENWYKRFHARLLEIAKDALAKEYPNSKGEKQFNSYPPGVLYKKSAEFCSRWKATTSVVNQGDSWAPNFLIRTNPTGKPEVLLLDFQLARCVSPVLDLSFFIYSCTDQTLREKHFDDLLKIYYNELSKTIKVLGSNPEKVYSWEQFSKEVKEQFVHGVTFGLESVTFGMLPADETFDLDVIKEDKVDIADVWTVQNIKTPEDRRRLAGIILHAADRGFL